jgi:hypothetical protein
MKEERVVIAFTQKCLMTKKMEMGEISQHFINQEKNLKSNPNYYNSRGLKKNKLYQMKKQTRENQISLKMKEENKKMMIKIITMMEMRKI